MSKPDDIPSCADCEMIGFPVPEILTLSEKAVGVDVLYDFLTERAGGEFSVRRDVSAEYAAENPVGAFLSREIGWGKVMVPLGPLSYRAKMSWAIYLNLKAGHSHSQTARNVNCNILVVRKHRKRLELLGLLELRPSNPNGPTK